MILVPFSFDGHEINDGTNFEAWFERDTPINAPVQLGLVQRAQNFPKLATKRLNGKPLSFYIKCLGTVHTQMQTLKSWFDPYSQDEALFVVRDVADSNTEYFWRCVVTDMPTIEGEAVLQVNLFATNPILAGCVELSQTGNLTASGQTVTVTPGGSARTQPRIEVTPTGSKSSNNYARRSFVQIVNKTTRVFPEMAFDITDGGIDASALVSASLLQNDLSDLRVWVNGAEVDFWTSNTVADSSLKIFTNLSFEAMKRLTLKTAIPSSGAVSDIYLVSGTTALKNLKSMKANGIVVIDNEVFTYTSIDTKAYALRGVTRTAKGTTIAGHSASSYVYYVEHDIWIVYGNAAATAWVPDDSKKPIFDLALSENDFWVFSEFADDLWLRTGEFKGRIISSSGKESSIYTATELATANPATAMGIAVRAWQKSGRWQGETCKAEWRFYHPAEITMVSADGKKYRSATSWPATVKLQRSQNGEDWTDVWSEATPSTAANWEVWSHLSQAITGSEYLRFVISGSVSAVANNLAAFEVDCLELTFDSADLPEITIISPIVSYYLDLTLTNAATGDWIAVRWPMAISDTLVIDCENKTVEHVDGTNAFAPMEFSSVRAGWLDLLPGVANQITYADTGTSGATVRVYYRNREI